MRRSVAARWACESGLRARSRYLSHGADGNPAAPSQAPHRAQRPSWSSLPPDRADTAARLAGRRPVRADTAARPPGTAAPA